MTERKTILVTGASRGIGLLSAKALAHAGHHVFAGMRDAAGRNAPIASELRAWASSNGLRLEPIEVDVTKDASVDRAVQTIEGRQPIDVLINNAGVMPVGITEAYTPDQVEACLDVNFVGAVRTCRAVLPGMRSRRSGLIIHLSSTAGRLAIPFFGLYCASKWALEAYGESLHYELSDLGIESIILEPGGHATDLIKVPPGPSDLARLGGYGAVANGPRRMIDLSETMFAAGGAATDAHNIADVICELVSTKRPRPIRTTVGHDMGVARINKSVAPVQAELIESLPPGGKAGAGPTASAAAS